MAEPLPLMNVYEVETAVGNASLICFLDPVLAGAKGIDPRSILGVYKEGENGDFDLDGFTPNPAFVEALTGYMNEEAAGSTAVLEQAKGVTSGWLYILDPRDPGEADAEPATINVLGAFAVDDTGQVVPGSFQYNKNHTLFDRAHGPSGVLRDKQFYGWLHGVGPEPRR